MTHSSAPLQTFHDSEGHDSTAFSKSIETSLLSRLSLNQKTTNNWSVEEAVAGCVRAAIPAIGLWREPVQLLGIEKTAQVIADSGLRVSSLCRGGYFTASDDATWMRALDDNCRAVDEAAVLKAECLVLVVGGLSAGSRDLAAARSRIIESLDRLAVYAQENGVRLALEPMHPIYCADRGVLSTLAQALDIAEQYPAQVVGVVVDSFHVWWDPKIEEQIERATGRIASLQLADWITPLPPDALLSRGMIGDGHIDLRKLTSLVDQTGYQGDIEIEIFNADVWAANGDRVLDTLRKRFIEHVA